MRFQPFCALRDFVRNGENIAQARTGPVVNPELGASLSFFFHLLLRINMLRTEMECMELVSANQQRDRGNSRVLLGESVVGSLCVARSFCVEHRGPEHASGLACILA